MDLRSDLPFWLLRNGLIHTYAALETNLRCDVLVIGGGITGALVGHELSRRGIDAVLVDRRHIAYGSTSASTGLLQYEIDTPLHKLTEICGRAKAERAYMLGVEAIGRLQRLAGSQCGFSRRPSLMLAKNRQHIADLRREFQARKEAGLGVQWLEQAQLRKMGLNRPAAIASEVAGEVDPYLLTHKLLKSSGGKGLRVFDRTGIVNYTHEKRRVIAKTDRGVKISCNAIVFATGYEVREILPPGLFRVESTYAFISEPVPDLGWWKDRSLLWESGEAYLYARTTSDSRVIVGGADDNVQNGKRRDARVAAKCRILSAQFRRLCPDAAPIESAFSWGGAFGHTKDGLAYIGRHPRFPRGLFALGFGGNGITFSETAAKILADCHQGRKNGDAPLFAFERATA